MYLNCLHMNIYKYLKIPTKKNQHVTTYRMPRLLNDIFEYKLNNKKMLKQKFYASLNVLQL